MKRPISKSKAEVPRRRREMKLNTEDTEGTEKRGEAI